ncbi:MAG: PKD domain-containing protein, partial [candidate division WOR-3 bacterium]
SPKSYGYGSDFVDKGDEALQDAGETNIGKKLGLDGMDLSGKKAKYAKLRKYFSHNEDLLAAVLILENKNNAPAFTNLAGQKLAQKREEMISQMENQVERQMWKSLLYLLEASATPPKDLEKLVKDLEKLESDLNLAGYDLSDLRGLNNGMMDAIKKEVQSQISKDYYGVFVYKKYYDAYSQIKRIQDQIIQLWTEEYKVDWQKMINPPLKMIIGGRKNCAPRLTLDIVNDLDKTKAALSAHRNRGRKIDSDLSDALGHNPKSKEELEYLKKLAQLGFEIEHLFDDCKERSIDTCEADTVQAINERLIQYKEYLKNLKISECTYQYTDWGECDKIKKIQTRKLIKKTPEGCIEKEKPETQRACTHDKKDTEGKKPEKEQLEKEKIEKEKIEKEKDWRNLIELKKKLLSGDSKNIESTLEAINKGLEKIEKEMMEWIQGYKPYLDSLRKADEEAFGKLRAALFRLTDEKVRCRQCSTGGACPKYCGEFDECIKEPKNLHNKQQDWIKKIETEMQRVIHSLQEGTIEQRLQKIEDTASKYGLPRPYPIKVEPPVKYQSYCLGIVDSDKEDRLTVELRTNRITLKPGNIATISAVVSGGKLPYTYKWSENVSGSGTNVQFVSQKKGDYIISVTVFDSEGKKANGQITLKVESIEVTIEGLPKQVVYGTKHTLIAKIPGPDKASSSELKKFEDEMKRLKCAKAYDPNEEDWNGCYSCPALEKGKTKSITRCRPKTGSSGITVTWQSSPNIQFDPPSGEGPTTALFNSMGDNGKVKIWAIVEKDKSESFETPQYEVNVVPPKFMLFFDPDKGRGKVGQEISATLKTDPDIDSKLIDYEWSEPEFSKRKQYEANAGKIGFIPKDAKPVKLLVAPKVPYYRTPIGGAISDEYTASPYTVTISEPRYRQSKPVIWKCDTRSGGARSCGNVEVDYEFAVDYDILMRAEVLPKLDGVNYKWTVSPQGCTLMNDITQDLTIKCSLTGTYTASVTVTKEIEGRKAEIGSVSRSVNITISQEEMKNSNKRKEAAEKLAKSKEFAKQGKLDEAIVAAEEAERLDPKNIEASNLAAQLIKERQYILREIKNIKDLADQAQFDAAQKSFTQIFNKYGKYQPVWEVQHYIGNQITKYNTLVRDRFYEVQKANDEKNFSNALEIIKNIQQTMKLQPVDVQKLQQIEQWTAKMETIKGKKRE